MSTINLLNLTALTSANRVKSYYMVLIKSTSEKASSSYLVDTSSNAASLNITSHTDFTMYALSAKSTCSSRSSLGCTRPYSTLTNISTPAVSMLRNSMLCKLVSLRHKFLRSNNNSECRLATLWNLRPDKTKFYYFYLTGFKKWNQKYFFKTRHNLNLT